MANRTFNDVYRQIFRVTDDMLAGRMDVQRSMAFAANMKVMNDIINTEIKLRAMERAIDKPLPALGSVSISTASQVIDQPDETLCVESVRLIAYEPNKEAKKPKKRKPKIGIVGLMPIQAGNVSSQFASYADFSFWNDGDDLRSLDAMANCDVVFLHTSHMSHKTQERLEAKRANLVPVGGGSSSMKAAMQKYFKAIADEMPA